MEEPPARGSAVVRGNHDERVAVRRLHDAGEEPVHDDAHAENSSDTRPSRPCLLEQVDVDVVELVDDREVADDQRDEVPLIAESIRSAFRSMQSSLGAISAATGICARASRWSLIPRTTRNALISMEYSGPASPSGGAPQSGGNQGAEKEKLAIDKMGTGGRASAQTKARPSPTARRTLSLPALSDGQGRSRNGESRSSIPWNSIVSGRPPRRKMPGFFQSR